MIQNRRAPKTGREPTIALINIVFLMLVFFMIAGTLAVPIDKEVELIETRTLDGNDPPEALVLHADGHLSLRNEAVTDLNAYMAGLSTEERQTLRLVPDRSVPARKLVSISAQLRTAGAERVVIVSKKALN